MLNDHSLTAKSTQPLRGKEGQHSVYLISPSPTVHNQRYIFFNLFIYLFHQFFYCYTSSLSRRTPLGISHILVFLQLVNQKRYLTSELPTTAQKWKNYVITESKPWLCSCYFTRMSNQLSFWTIAGKYPWVWNYIYLYIGVSNASYHPDIAYSMNHTCHN